MRRRDIHVAMRDGTWQDSVAWIRAWNTAGRPVVWRCQIEIGGHAAWYVYRGDDLRVVRAP